ncbi:MAG TPA: hypothetical protein DCQ97_04655 [Chitinophagaceae bacterium]|nr:hypothetical protein [Chitinophagaceae bacterium]
MLKAPTEFIEVFIVITTVLIFCLMIFITIIIHRYQVKQNAYFRNIETLKISHQNTLLQSQLEIQEQTFQNISREIHDSIGQKLTLAKLHLNTLDHSQGNGIAARIMDSVEMITEVINDLSDISKSMNSEIILNNGLIKALEFEASQLLKSGRYAIDFSVSGSPVFLAANSELVLFRIAQEALTNIIKHAEATEIKIRLHYNSNGITLIIEDNGKGFKSTEINFGTGLSNMKKRAGTLNGKLTTHSTPHTCTQIIIEIPLYENNNHV